MRISELKKSGAFVVSVFVLVLVLLPFGIEEISDTFDLGFKFSVMDTVAGWFGATPSAGPARAEAKPVDWDAYRRDLEDFSRWAEEQAAAEISPPANEPEVFEVAGAAETAPTRSLWRVSVTGCSALGAGADERRCVYVAGHGRTYAEGDVIPPSDGLCGYEIIFIGERTVYFRAVFEPDGDVATGRMKLPEFSKIDGEYLINGRRRFVSRDAFRLNETGGYLMIDSVRPPDTVVFKLLDKSYTEVATILCIVIGEKGGR